MGTAPNPTHSENCFQVQWFEVLRGDAADNIHFLNCRKNVRKMSRWRCKICAQSACAYPLLPTFYPRIPGRALLENQRIKCSDGGSLPKWSFPKTRVKSAQNYLSLHLWNFAQPTSNIVQTCVRCQDSGEWTRNTATRNKKGLRCFCKCRGLSCSHSLLAIRRVQEVRRAEIIGALHSCPSLLLK